ncbi:MAG: family 20 glycosylhydrolase [Muribaculaceae bacterium]|nr:family 20 glycosylhydrolase [Muribaculaceae bacterium]
MTLKKTLIAAMLIIGSALAHATNPKPFTVPEVSNWKGGEGSFTPALQTTRIVADPKSAEAQNIARLFSQDYTTMCGTALPVVAEKAKKGDISLQIKKDKKAGAEAYSIKITPDGVTLTAPTEQGLYWATRTLLQLTENSEDGISLPVGTITDSPAFGMRGFMIDCGRKYIPMDYLYALVNTMSYYKMNTLAVHLNDNGFPRYYDNDWSKTQAAFRLESETFPGLTARDGSYTKREFRDFIAYAKSKGVEIIPEIDVPAHSLAFTRFKPEIASTGRNGFDHLDITKPETHQFIEQLFTEYLEGPDPVFSGPRFNIGTDEYQGDSITMEQFRGFTDHFIRFVEKFDKQPLVWGSLTHAKGKTPVKVDNVLMLCWSNGYADPKEMLKLGYDVVSIPDGWVYIVPKAGYYYDYLNTDLLYNHWTPANIGGQVFSGDTISQIKGGMFAVWNDVPSNGITVKDIAHRVMAALPTMAAKTWSADKTTVPYKEFISRSSNMMEAPGVNYLGRYGNRDEATEVLNLGVVNPGQKLPIPEIGYDYTVEFDITGAAEAKGTKLFESPYATFWLSDPVTGNMGYSREDKLYTYRQNILPGEKLHVKITGNNAGTKLYVNDKLVDDMNVLWFKYSRPNAEGRLQPVGGYESSLVRTLVFPLDKAGDFKSKVTNFRVINAIR